MGGKRPTPPDPMVTAQAQQGYNRESMRDAAMYNQMNQNTPWGNVSYSGELGSPDRAMNVSLNPQDQQRMDMIRALKGGALNSAGAGGKAGPSQAMPPMEGG